jgi:hypothetical protein
MGETEEVTGGEWLVRGRSKTVIGNQAFSDTVINQFRTSRCLSS